MDRYQRKNRRACALMLAMSVCFRLCMHLGLDVKAAQWLAEAVKKPETAKFLLYLETGKTVQERLPLPELLVLKLEEPRKMPITVTRAPAVKTVPASRIEIGGGCTYEYKKQELLARQTAMDLTSPCVLIVHSHSSESYSGCTADFSPYRTLDEEQSVIAVGDVLAKGLKSCGVQVLHDRSCNDYPNYNVSYWNCLQKIEAWKEEYPNIQMVIDVHRDAVEDKDGNAVALLSDDSRLAKLMLVVGTDEGGLTHPDWQENLANALKLQSVIEGEYPGLCRKIDLRTERFNQHTAPGAVLVEVGSNGNTLEQAKQSAACLADAIAKLLRTLKENDGILPDI